MMWHCFDEPYVGAAHGIVGILKMLLDCHSLLAPRSQQLVVDTLGRLLRSRFASGNLPIILGERSDEHVHWCHGAPGIPALALAAERALGDPDGQLRDAALRAAEVVWRRDPRRAVSCVFQRGAPRSPDPLPGASRFPSRVFFDGTGAQRGPPEAENSQVHPVLMLETLGARSPLLTAALQLSRRRPQETSEDHWKPPKTTEDRRRPSEDRRRRSKANG
ncbi:unnamed protein product [Prorocentrum cordatum]|uniref:Uncharacterized protein n=1 Tax=Prorocentrum cordatum TaxID=2364126 RepID=A0ABN9Q702_9DINO|nr:unnamed protein product [Polarella glacialis]